MVPNVVGMSQYADGGRDGDQAVRRRRRLHRPDERLLRRLRRRPEERVGANACPFTAGYWAFLDRHRDRFATNHRMRQPVQGLHRLTDLAQVAEQERQRGAGPP